MTNLDRPKRLITFASENNIAKKEKFRFTTRVKAYSVVLVLIASALVSMLATREIVDVTILRIQGMIYQKLPDGNIGNLYSARMFNKTHRDLQVGLSIDPKEGSIEVLGKQPLIAKESYAVITFLIKKKANNIKKRNNDIYINISVEGKNIGTKKTSFLGPISK